MKRLMPLLLIVTLIPQVAFAAWWNPLSWKFFNRIFTPKNEVVEIATTTDSNAKIEKLKEEIEVLRKQAPNPTTTPSQRQNYVPVAISTELLIEKCKAKKGVSRGILWPVVLETVELAEQKTYQSRLGALMETIQSGTVPASYLAITVKISYAEHEKNLETAEAVMETQLAKEYMNCLNGK